MRCRISEVAALIIKSLGEPLPGLSAALFVLQEAGYVVAKLIAAQLIVSYAHQGELLWQQLRLNQVVQSRDQLALRQIARRSEKHDCARTGSPPYLLRFGLSI